MGKERCTENHPINFLNKESESDDKIHSLLGK